jgi:isocitrate dehydrogenase
MTTNNAITIAYGDGIGPEIMESTIKILQNAGTKLRFNTIEVGEEIYKKGFNCGITPSAWKDLESSKILLKAPITTPQGKGYKSLNVTLRKKLGLYSNIRPVTSFYPFVNTKHPKMDVVIVRENEEDLYLGLEYRHTEQFHQSLKVITKEGCEKIISHAFEYAVNNNRKKICCFSKDNIMKITDGLFHKTFDEIAKNYPEIETDHQIIDIGTAKLAATPEDFDVIVTLNLYGDIISDVAAQIAGSVGLAPSANIGSQYAMFEAIHGSAPDIAGKNIANPTGLIQAAIMMLVHLNQNNIADKIRNALFKTIEDGIHTADIYNKETSTKKVSTTQFTDEVINNLGQKPTKLPVANFQQGTQTKKTTFKAIASKPDASRNLIGFDLFIDWKEEFEDLIELINSVESDKLQIKTISAKGLIMWPHLDKYMVPQYPGGQTMLRFIAKKATGKASNDIIDNNITISHQDIVDMLTILTKKKVDFIKIENLHTFDGAAGYSAIQGE